MFAIYFPSLIQIVINCITIYHQTIYRYMPLYNAKVFVIFLQNLEKAKYFPAVGLRTTFD